jgi:hypothetical protein
MLIAFLDGSDGRTGERSFSINFKKRRADAMPRAHNVDSGQACWKIGIKGARRVRKVRQKEAPERPATRNIQPRVAKPIWISRL